MEGGYMFKVGDVVKVYNGFTKEGYVIGKVGFVDFDNDLWLVLDHSYDDQASSNSSHFEEGENEFETPEFMKFIKGVKYWCCNEGYRTELVEPVRKTKLAIKMIPKKDILKETEEWLWLK